MATRKQITEAVPGIEDDAVSKLLNLIHSETDPLRDSIDDLEKQLKTAQGERDTAKNEKNAAVKDLADYKAAQSKKESKTAKEAAYRKLLEEANVGETHRGLIIRGTDIDALELDENGALKNASKLSEAIKTDYAPYIVKTNVKGASVAHPPASGAKGKYQTKEEIMKIQDTAERQAAIAENHDLFGF